MDITPNISASDQSANDESMHQEGVTINASNGSIVNANSGNGHGRVRSMKALVFMAAVLYLFGLGAVAYQVKSIGARMDYNNTYQQKNIERLDIQIRDLDTNIKNELKKAHEGNIWLLRHDLLKSMELFEAKGEITENVFHALQDEYKHYRAIGGNYDVEERWSDFKYKVMSDKVKLKKLMK